MRTSLKRLLSLFALPALIACDPPDQEARVFVEYKQVANFYDYRLSPDASGSHGAGDGMFIMYKVTKIKNNGSAALQFNFDEKEVVTVTPEQASNDTVLDGSILLGSKYIGSAVVSAGETKIVNNCFIKKAYTTNPSSLVSAQVPALYRVKASQPVSMTNIAPAGNVASVGNALPNALASLCTNN